MKKQTNEHTKKRMKGWTKEQTKEWTKEHMKVQPKERRNDGQLSRKINGLRTAFLCTILIKY